MRVVFDELAGLFFFVQLLKVMNLNHISTKDIGKCFPFKL